MNLVQPITRFTKLLINKTQTSFFEHQRHVQISIMELEYPISGFEGTDIEHGLFKIFTFDFILLLCIFCIFLHQDTQWMRTRFWFIVFYGKTKSANLFHLIKIKCQLEIGRYPTNGNEILWCFCELWLETSFVEFLIFLHCVYFWSK